MIFQASDKQLAFSELGKEAITEWVGNFSEQTLFCWKKLASVIYTEMGNHATHA